MGNHFQFQCNFILHRCSNEFLERCACGHLGNSNYYGRIWFDRGRDWGGAGRNHWLDRKNIQEEFFYPRLEIWSCDRVYGLIGAVVYELLDEWLYFVSPTMIPITQPWVADRLVVSGFLV